MSVDEEQTTADRLIDEMIQLQKNKTRIVDVVRESAPAAKIAELDRDGQAAVVEAAIRRLVDSDTSATSPPKGLTEDQSRLLTRFLIELLASRRKLPLNEETVSRMVRWFPAPRKNWEWQSDPL
ncbi:MAG TPA: hypothetical protein VFT74_21390, partial [Isosphaeraceae bacterium]|nr:hypothetical protein [Isosphaeraceae bacterium]